MKLALSYLCSVLVGAQVWCVPDACKVDSNCADNIHPLITGKCCGGKCVRDTSGRQRLIGEQCAPLDISHADNFEQCFASCAGGLFCNTVDERCHAKKGVGCPCLANRECLSGGCREESHVCSGQNLPLGESCEQNYECSSNLCSNKKCSALAIGQRCPNGITPCVPGAVCRRNDTLSFTTSCETPCAAGVVDCCFSGDSACAANLKCTFANYSCYAPAPVVLPGLGEECAFSVCSNSTTMICANECNGGGCGSTRVCQLRNQLAVGTPCDTTAQCVVGTTCQYNLVNATLQCTELPTFAPTGSPTRAPTAALNTVPLGQPCGDSPRNFNLCMAPGNMCEQNATGVYVCKQSGTTPVGALCSLSSLSIDVRALDECVKGSRCTQNGTFGSFACRTPIPVGQRCHSTTEYRDYNFPECENGWDNCKITGRSCSGFFGSCDSNDSYGNPCCTCVAPRTVPDGKNCSTSSQCQKVTSICLAENNTCGNIQGIDCVTPGDCRDSRFDCNCDRKCYLLRAPTSSRTSFAPTASTRAPSIYTARCDAQQKAWEALPASITYNEFSNFPYLLYTTFHTVFVPETLKLTQAEQAILIAYVCCDTCPRNSRFNSHIYAGYQVDCGAKKLIKLEDTCNDLRGTWALANCWGALSAAPSLNIGLGAFVATLLLFLF